MQLIVHYIVNGKLAAVVDYAKAQGWRVATDKPKGRQYTLDDIRELLSNPPEGWTKELIGLAYSSYWTERRLIDRGEIM